MSASSAWIFWYDISLHGTVPCLVRVSVRFRVRVRARARARVRARVRVRVRVRVKVRHVTRSLLDPPPQAFSRPAPARRGRA